MSARMMPRLHPPVVDVTLATGLRILLARRPTVPLVQLRLAVPFGAPAGDGPEGTPHVALAELLAASLLSGTHRRDRVGIDDELSAAGAALKVTVRPQHLRISGHALAAELPAVADLLTDCLAGAAYRPEAVALEQARLLERIRLTRTRPEWVARAGLLAHCFGDHRAATELPSPEHLARVAAGQVATLHARQVVPGGSVLVVVGDIDPEETVETLADRLSGWASARPAVALRPPPAPAGGPVRLRHLPGARQAEVRLAAPALPRADAAFPALRLAGHVFGGYFGSRLVRHLRDTRQYVHCASFGIEELGGLAMNTVRFGCAPEHGWPAVDETLMLLDRVSGAEPPRAAAIAAARGHLAGVTALAQSTQAGLAEELCELAAAGLGPDWLAGFGTALHTVGDDEVRAAAARYLRPDAYTGVLLAPESVSAR